MPYRRYENVVAYQYEADRHCPSCAMARFGRVNLPAVGEVVPEDAEDREGNAVTPIYWDDSASWCSHGEDGEESWGRMFCADCLSLTATCFCRDPDEDASDSCHCANCEAMRETADEGDGDFGLDEQFDYDVAAVERFVESELARFDQARLDGRCVSISASGLGCMYEADHREADHRAFDAATGLYIYWAPVSL